MAIVDSPGISPEEEGDPNFTNINAGTTMRDNTTPPTRPTYNEAETSTENKDMWDYVENKLQDMRVE